jgi:tRNA1(Val) A37 N6-methylase TrmN6
MSSSDALSERGAVFTPNDFADLLASWAIQDKCQRVIDTGVGEGSLTFAAYKRLIELGAEPSKAQSQIYGSEIHSSTYRSFQNQAIRQSIEFPNIRQGDFFKQELPQVETIIGNPPYVRCVAISNIDAIRKRVIGKNKQLSEQGISRLSDLYIYFLLYAMCHLKPGGRLAVITADSWLNARYGESFKLYLKANFEIKALINLDRQVFDAEVKPVLLFAVKKSDQKTDSSEWLRFIRVRNGLPVNKLLSVIDSYNSDLPDLSAVSVKLNELEAKEPWGVHFKASYLLTDIASHPKTVHLSDIGKTKIGIQTLAKDFFVLSPDQVKESKIERRFLRPMIYSSKYWDRLKVEPGDKAHAYIFYCSKYKREIDGTNALRYIVRGERKEVKVRGKNKTVTGYHKKERIQKAGRRNWYDLKTHIERRGKAEILIPRLIAKKFQVIWNKALYVPGELFIEFFPKAPLFTDLKVYLAILNSSLFEVSLRIDAQLYGGGSYNISPGRIGKTWVPDVGQLTEEDKVRLIGAYKRLLEDPIMGRQEIDEAVYSYLNYDAERQKLIAETLSDLIKLGEVNLHTELETD